MLRAACSAPSAFIAELKRSAKKMKILSRIKTGLIILVIGLFAVPIFFESILGFYLIPLSGWQRPTWGILFFAASVFLLIIPVFTGVRMRRIASLDIVCWGAIIFAWIAYPLSVRAYCDLASRHRQDTMHWTGQDGIYYFVDSRYPDTFSGLIQIYPPLIRLPKY